MSNIMLKSHLEARELTFQAFETDFNLLENIPIFVDFLKKSVKR